MCIDQMEVFLFFFSSRRRHTRFDCDWSSDVCSSDLLLVPPVGPLENERLDCGLSGPAPRKCLLNGEEHMRILLYNPDNGEIGRASCRERGEISGVAVSLKKKKRKNSVCSIDIKSSHS